MIMNMILLVVELTKVLLVMCGCLNYELKRRFVAAWCVFGVSEALIVVVNYFDKDYELTTFYFVVVLISALMLKGKRKMLLSLVAFLGVSMIDTIIQVFVLKIPSEKVIRVLVESRMLNIFGLVLIMIVATILQKFYYPHKQKEEQDVENSSGTYLWLFSIGMTVAMIAMAPFASINADWDGETLRKIAICFFVFSVLFLFTGGLLIYNSYSSKHYKRVAKINKELLETKEKYYQMVLEKEEETRRFRHDMSSHLVCVAQLLKENEVQKATEYLEGIHGIFRELSIEHQTGNTLVNAIVNDISGRYQNVKLHWEGHLPKEMNISDMDICVIFSNLLENAFHAATECEDGWIKVRVEVVAGAVKVRIDNSMARPVNEKEGKFITQKLDKKNHGLGTGNVKECVKKNDGEINFLYTDRIFTADLVLLNAVQG